MKGLIIFILAAFASIAYGMLAASIDDTLYRYQDECTIESGADSSLVERSRRARQLSDDGKLDTFANCMLKKFNILNNDNKYNDDVRSYRVPSDTNSIFTVSNICRNEDCHNIGEASRKIMNCFLKNNEILFPLAARCS